MSFLHRRSIRKGMDLSHLLPVEPWARPVLTAFVVLRCAVVLHGWLPEKLCHAIPQWR
jgi:hypothetical protein